MTRLTKLIAAMTDPGPRTRWIVHLALGTLGWLAVALSYPFLTDLPRYALY